MNVEKLKRLQSQVRIGGKGTPRRKKKVMHQTAATDDKKLQSSLKKLSVSTIPGIEEVNIIKDDLTVIHFNNPKAQASLSANTFAVTGHGETKKVMEMLPDILPQLGQETVAQLRMYATSMNQQKINGDQTGSGPNDDDEVPELVGDFDEVAKVEAEQKDVKKLNEDRQKPTPGKQEQKEKKQDNKKKQENQNKEKSNKNSVDATKPNGEATKNKNQSKPESKNKDQGKSQPAPTNQNVEIALADGKSQAKPQPEASKNKKDKEKSKAAQSQGKPQSNAEKQPPKVDTKIVPEAVQSQSKSDSQQASSNNSTQPTPEITKSPKVNESAPPAAKGQEKSPPEPEKQQPQQSLVDQQAKLSTESAKNNVNQSTPAIIKDAAKNVTERAGIAEPQKQVQSQPAAIKEEPKIIQETAKIQAESQQAPQTKPIAESAKTEVKGKSPPAAVKNNVKNDGKGKSPPTNIKEPIQAVDIQKQPVIAKEAATPTGPSQPAVDDN
ncbi:uncharacterized protein uncNacbeta isoform X2 [Drosophila tropicalis]|uniref:uncharacterized protein uncNacbeta isoform X2 n=1 Tax=Drosophila tropicalis TaxID=46794 RepID=UPI0035AB80B7